MINALYAISIFLLGYFTLLWLGYLIMLGCTLKAIIQKFKETDVNPIIKALNANPLLPITIIIPAFNESKRILKAIDAILKADYKNIHLIIVNDGSKDSTLALLIKTYQLLKVPAAYKVEVETGQVYGYYIAKDIPNFLVIDKQHSPFENSAADCINAGLNACRTPLYLTVDADTLLEKEALSRILFEYLISAHCIAVGGAIYVPDTMSKHGQTVAKTLIPSNLVLGTQVCEYLRSFIYGRQGWKLMGGSLCHPGAFTLLETKAVRDAGCYDSANFSYDAEIILKLHHYMRSHHYPYTISYAPSAISWSEEPHTLALLWGQRSRWQRGLLRCLSHHKAMIFNPAYGVTGLLAFPYYIIFEIFGPCVEAVSYIVLILALYFIPGVASFIGCLVLLAVSYILFITMACVILSGLTYDKYTKNLDILRLVGMTLVDMIFFRQWRAFCALFSSVHYLLNRLRGKAE